MTRQQARAAKRAESKNPSTFHPLGVYAGHVPQAPGEPPKVIFLTRKERRRKAATS